MSEKVACDVRVMVMNSIIMAQSKLAIAIPQIGVDSKYVDSKYVEVRYLVAIMSLKGQQLLENRARSHAAFVRTTGRGGEQRRL